MKNTLETRLGIFFALAMIAAIMIVELIGGFDFFKKGVTVRARFDQVQELKEGDSVKMAGVHIGRVERIALVENQVEVRLKLTKPDQVKTDSIAAIKFLGLLGQNYVGIEFGSPNAPTVTENAILETREQADLADLMTKLEGVASGVQEMTKSFSSEGMGNMLAPLNDFLIENSPRLAGIVTNFQAVSEQIAGGRGTVGRLIMEDTLHETSIATLENFSATTEDIKAAIAQARDVVGKIQEGQGTLGKLMTDEALYAETTAAMVSLREILGKINQGDGFAGKLVNDETLFRNVKLTLQKVEKATEGLEDQGPLSILGIAINTLF